MLFLEFLSTLCLLLLGSDLDPRHRTNLGIGRYDLPFRMGNKEDMTRMALRYGVVASS